MKRVAVALAALLAVATGALVALNRLDESTPPELAAPGDPARGAYVARIGHCEGCHTARGGAPYAGGHAVPTPFGAVFAPNLTPDASGLGGWRAQDLWRALHNGRSADGRLLAPACPYPNYSFVSARDVSDLFAYLQGLAPVAQPNRPHELAFPYGTQPALAVWRALYFRPGTPPADRGEALVAGLGHCSACHGRRNAWGATGGALDLGGGEIPMQGWIAPALDDPAEGGVAGWPLADVQALLVGGQARGAGMSGPMARVVAHSTQYLAPADAEAIAHFLQRLPVRTRERRPAPPPPPEQAALGARVYERHCASCHGKDGEGHEPMAPALAGNRAVVLARPDNVLRMVLGGGFGPATAAHPRPFGMPPFATLLSDDEVAAVVSHLRSSWGHRASAVQAVDVNRRR